ncbi:MAG: threonine/serine dehydratase [Pseudomonadota bacterium]
MDNSTPAAEALPTFDDITAAATRLRGHAVRTPLLQHPALDAAAGGTVLVKAENLQRVGAFKFRGAYNAISRLSADAYPGGVVACSSGNHAQGVATAASLLGFAATIVMPSDAPALKIARTRAAGAEVVLYDRVNEDREAIAKGLCGQLRAAFVHPFDNPDVIAGQGTAGVEMMEQAAERGLTPDAVVVCVSGGGLLGGIALAVKAHAPTAQLYAAEPAGFDDMARSLVSGQREHNEAASGSICDALLTPSPGAITFALAREHVSAGLVVTDDEVREAMRFAFTEMKLVVEPGGAVALAAVLTGKLETRGRCTGVLISGGNVDPATFATIINS